MPARARRALIGAGAGVALLALTWWLSRHVGPVRRADAAILTGFEQLDRPHVDAITNFIAGLCDPHRYLLLAPIPVVMALWRRRPRVAVAVVLVLLAANETTQLIKPLLAAPRVPVAGGPMTDASWPSGHATAAMSLALCCVIAAAPRWRPWVAAAMAAFAVAVSWSFLELGWHYPSDVLGGFLVAATWALLAVAALWTIEARRTPGRRKPDAEGSRRRVSVREALAPALTLAVAALVLAVLILVARPQQVIEYARNHEVFVVGAAAIGTIALTLATGLGMMLTRG
ncbi:MAG: phosphatase PAP2 family protein [Solirubrobacteraceae bacterium]